MDGVFQRSPGTQIIRQAMEECLDVDDVVTAQVGSPGDAASAVDYRLHRQWLTSVGGGAVASVPLRVGEKTLAVLSVMRRGDNRFGSGELDEILQTVTPFAPTLPLVDRAGRGLMRHALAVAGRGLRSALAPQRWGRKLAFVLAISVASWFAVGDVNYRLSVPCQIQANSVRHFAAPFDGTIAAFHVREGDRVAAGQLLFEMDIAELELRRRQLLSDQAVAELERSQALADDDIMAAALAQARMQVLQAEADIVSRKIRQARCYAPAAGTVIGGELAQRVGEVVPIGETLVELATDEDWVVELAVREADILEMRPGIVGGFATMARPSESVGCRVERVDPAATARDGNNVFLVRARVSDNPQWMRVGMEGIATLELGERRVWWVALHRVVDFVRLQWWN